jgi:hypothetical protein
MTSKFSITSLKLGKHPYLKFEVPLFGGNEVGERSKRP